MKKYMKMMFALLVAVALTAALSACSDDKDNKEGEPADPSTHDPSTHDPCLIGTWDYEDNDDEFWESYTFRKDGRFEFNGAEEGDRYQETGTWSNPTSYSRVTLVYDDGESETLPYRISGNRLYLDSGSTTDVYVKRN